MINVELNTEIDFDERTAQHSIDVCHQLMNHQLGFKKFTILLASATTYNIIAELNHCNEKDNIYYNMIDNSSYQNSKLAINNLFNIMKNFIYADLKVIHFKSTIIIMKLYSHIDEFIRSLSHYYVHDVIIPMCGLMNNEGHINTFSSIIDEEEGLMNIPRWNTTFKKAERLQQMMKDHTGMLKTTHSESYVEHAINQILHYEM